MMQPRKLQDEQKGAVPTINMPDDCNRSSHRLDKSSDGESLSRLNVHVEAAITSGVSLTTAVGAYENNTELRSSMQKTKQQLPLLFSTKTSPHVCTISQPTMSRLQERKMGKLRFRHSVLCIFYLIASVSVQQASAFVTKPVSHVSGAHKKSTSTIPVLNASSNKKTEPFDDNGAKNLAAKKKGKLIPGIAFMTLLSCAMAAKLGFIPGPSLSNSHGMYTDAMIARDIGAALLTGTLGYGFVKANTWLAEKNYLQPRDSRKIIHTFSAPLFMAFWPIFSAAEGARYFAASVSLVNAIRLFIAGSGGDKTLAFAVSRSGNEKEALGGPFLYVVILFFSIVLFWTDGPIGIIALSAMAAGDGLADLVGRRYGNGNKWPFNADKSIAGTVAFFAGATPCALILLKLLSIELHPTIPVSPELAVVGIMAITAVLEVLPTKIDDNYLVPLSAAVLTTLAFS